MSTADFNGDGWIDLYVANDGQPNQLWINQHDGTFKNIGLLSGTALSAHGKPKAGMGVDAGDFDNDGDEDLFVTNLTGEGNDLYVNDGSGLFEEQSARSGLGPASRPYTGFGAAWFDVDNDGWLDMLIVNGAVQTIEALRRVERSVSAAPAEAAVPQSGQRAIRGRHRARRAPRSQLSEVGRGAAFGDIDNDGDVDVLVANNNGKPRLLINNVGNRNHWIGLRLVGRQTAQGHAGRARRHRPRGRLDAVAQGAIGRQLRVGQRSASARWASVSRHARLASGCGGRAVRPRSGAPSAIDRYTTLKEGEGK